MAPVCFVLRSKNAERPPWVEASRTMKSLPLFTFGSICQKCRFAWSVMIRLVSKRCRAHSAIPSSRVGITLDTVADDGISGQAQSNSYA